MFRPAMMTPPPLDVARHALFLDFDGTLAGFVDDPAAIGVDPALRKRLAVLQGELADAFAIVSGRRVADLDRLLAPLTFAAAGVHGLERRRGQHGAIEMLAGPAALDEVRRLLRPSLDAMPRLMLEDKGTSLVLHYRTAPDLGEAARTAMRAATSGRADLVVMVGESIIETHPAGMNKGMAVAAFMQTAPFAGRVPVYLGDDVTDEFALKWVRGAAGVSVKVGSGPSEADYRLADVPAVHRWLGVRTTNWEAAT